MQAAAIFGLLLPCCWATLGIVLPGAGQIIIGESGTVDVLVEIKDERRLPRRQRDRVSAIMNTRLICSLDFCNRTLDPHFGGQHIVDMALWRRANESTRVSSWFAYSRSVLGQPERWEHLNQRAVGAI